MHVMNDIRIGRQFYSRTFLCDAERTGVKSKVELHVRTTSHGRRGSETESPPNTLKVKCVGRLGNDKDNLTAASTVAEVLSLERDHFERERVYGVKVSPGRCGTAAYLPLATYDDIRSATSPKHLFQERLDRLLSSQHGKPTADNTVLLPTQRTKNNESILLASVSVAVLAALIGLAVCTDGSPPSGCECAGCGGGGGTSRKGPAGGFMNFG